MDKLDLVVDRIEDLKQSTEKRLDSIDLNLAEHMKQTMLVREQNVLVKDQNSELKKQTEMLAELHRDNQTRIVILEEPKIVMSYIKKAALYVASICGAVLTIMKLME